MCVPFTPSNAEIVGDKGKGSWIRVLLLDGGNERIFTWWGQWEELDFASCIFNGRDEYASQPRTLLLLFFLLQDF